MFVSDEKVMCNDKRLQGRRHSATEQEREKRIALLPDVASKAQPTNWAQPKK